MFTIYFHPKHRYTYILPNYNDSAVLAVCDDTIVIEFIEQTKFKRMIHPSYTVLQINNYKMLYKYLKTQGVYAG